VGYVYPQNFNQTKYFVIPVAPYNYAVVVKNTEISIKYDDCNFAFLLFMQNVATDLLECAERDKSSLSPELRASWKVKDLK
jgi:hypothetical protein